ncbi:MAG: YhbY family RNA-binding protein [Clostridia bacterium]|nr:YhbY family RNA-binding protein [Clostridia bacterium]
MTSKQRAYLKSIASNEDTIFQLGKGGIDENFIAQVDSALEKREIVKIKALETFVDGPHFAAGEIAEATSSEVVQVIGTKFVLYRESKKNKKIILPR